MPEKQPLASNSLFTTHSSLFTTHSLSVVVVIFGGQKYLPDCLRSLTHQNDVTNMEIIVPYDDKLENLSSIQAEFPEVKFLYFKGFHTYAELRATGFREAQGKIIALTEGHCVPEPDWCANILEIHNKKSNAAIGGVVKKVEPDSCVNWALYLADYVRYMNPDQEGPSKHLTDCNVTYKASALQTINNIWKNEFHEPEVHEALQKLGKSLWFSSNIVVRQQRNVCFRDAVWDRYSFGRLFGSRRAVTLSYIKKIVYGGFAITFLTILLSCRVTKNVLINRQYSSELIRAFPALIVLNYFWALGEFVGYLTGVPGNYLKPETQPDDSKTTNEFDDL